MMGWIIEGSHVRYDDRPAVSFEYSVEELAESGDMAVVVVQVPTGAVMTENVFGVSRDGTRLWQIQWTAQTGSDPMNRYLGITRTDPVAGLVHIGNWNGDVVDVDIKTGKVVGHHFLR
jgi:hypothetical protein